MIKLIVSDVDGTLAEDGGSINPELFDVILKLKEQGIYFVAASGRHQVSLEHAFEPIKDRIFFISANGCYVGTSSRELFLTEYKKELAGDMIRDMRAAGMDMMIDGVDRVYSDSKNEEFIDWLVNGYHFRVERVEDLLQLEAPILKVSGCIMSGIAEGKAKYIQEKYGDRLKVTLAGKQWLDTMDPNVNKGNALKILQESLEILPEETMAFGDQLNDIEMLKRAYYSFAVSNARQEAKDASRFLADSNVNQGPMKIMKLFLNKSL